MWGPSGPSFTDEEMIEGGIRKQYLKSLILKLAQVGFKESHFQAYPSFINTPSHYGIKSVILCKWASLRARLLFSLAYSYWISPPKTILGCSEKSGINLNPFLPQFSRLGSEKKPQHYVFSLWEVSGLP